MKKLLALLLAVLMLFGLYAVGASAKTLDGDTAQAGLAPLAVDWDDFYIITQPEDQEIPFGSDFTLSVAVNVPAGAKVTYQWNRIEGATEPVKNF